MLSALQSGGIFTRCHLTLELVCGADFQWKLMCGAGPGDLGGSQGAIAAEISRETVPKMAGCEVVRSGFSSVMRGPSRRESP